MTLHWWTRTAPYRMEIRSLARLGVRIESTYTNFFRLILLNSRVVAQSSAPRCARLKGRAGLASPSSSPFPPGSLKLALSNPARNVNNVTLSLFAISLFFRSCSSRALPRAGNSFPGPSFRMITESLVCKRGLRVDPL